jgi:hypothetical protein
MLEMSGLPLMLSGISAEFFRVFQKDLSAMNRYFHRMAQFLHSFAQLKLSIMKEFLTFVLLMFTVFTGLAKDDEVKADTVKKCIENRSFVFIARSAIPLKGKFVSLTSSFDVAISGDTVTAYLPYYGEVHTAIFAGEEGGIKFTSVRNKYKVQSKKNGWIVTVKPEDAGYYGTELHFDISKSGNAMLRVSDNRRDPITFRGYLKL